MASGFTTIAATDITNNTTSEVTFTVPSGTSSNLMLLYKWATTSGTNIGLRFSGDTGTNYSYTLQHNWSSPSASYANSANHIFIDKPESSTTYSGSGCIYIPDSQTSNKCVTILGDGGGGGTQWAQGSGTWFNTSSRVTSVTVFCVTASRYFRDGSSVALYAMGDA